MNIILGAFGLRVFFNFLIVSVNWAYKSCTNLLKYHFIPFQYGGNIGMKKYWNAMDKNKKHRFLYIVIVVIIVATLIIYTSYCSAYHQRPIWDNHEYITPSLFNERFDETVSESYYKNDDCAYVYGEVIKDYMIGGAGRIDVKDVGSETGIIVIPYAISDPLPWTIGDIVYLKLTIIEKFMGSGGSYLIYVLDD